MPGLIDDLAPEARAPIDEVEGPSRALVAGVLRRFAGELRNVRHHVR